jgi:lipoprotein-anchoring transpeptidase ErfK/SrfK
MALAFACALAGALAAVLVAQPGLAASADDPPPTTTATEAVVPEGVRVSDIDVGGLTADEAVAAIRTAVESPLAIRVAKTVLMPTPDKLGATAYVSAAVAKALVAPPNSEVELTVRVAGAKVRAYVALLAKRFDRAPVDARLLLRGVRPFVTRQRAGRFLPRNAATAAIVRALVRNERLPLTLPLKALAPAVTRSNIGPVVVIQRESKRLELFTGMRFVKRFSIATGMPEYPTPLGRFQVVTKSTNPWWHPPTSDWAKGQDPIPPGPGNPLGTRWMGISSPGVGIHGTPDAASLGYSRSHGCIRMAISDAEWLFNRVQVGTTVFIARR